MPNEKLTHLSLFSGIGGIDLAATWAGFSPLAFVEIDPFCQKVLKKHWPNVPILEDVKNVKGKEIIEKYGHPTLVFGGFPCQPYSFAGKRKGKEDDRDLWPEMLRIIQEIRPTWVLGENVAGFINMGLERTLFDLENTGYETQAFVIPACGIGAPHRRERVFIVARRIPYTKCNSHDRYVENCRVFINRENNQNFWGSNWNEFELVVSKMAPSEWRKKGQPNSTRPLLLRNGDGFSTKLDKDRLKALGNAVVPQQVYPILKAIAEIELAKGEYNEE